MSLRQDFKFYSLIIYIATEEKGGKVMAKHKGGRVGGAARILASKSSTPKQKSRAAGVLKRHQDTKH